MAPDKLIRDSLKKGNSIGHLEYVDVTPIIGREYTRAKLEEIYDAPNRDEQLRDLAITICERGVVFFRARQDDLSVEEQKHITDLLGKLTGRPKENRLHVHLLYNDPNNIPMADGTTDKHTYVVNSEAQKKLYATINNRPGAGHEPHDLGREWHSDTLFENCPSDFSFLRMQSTPPSGGDTLWCSGYELYDRCSAPMQKFLESLTATCAQPVLESACTTWQLPRHVSARDGEDASGDGVEERICGVGLHVNQIDGLFVMEERMVREFVLGLVVRNHDAVARMHWTEEACAIWSNVCTLHAATPDTHLVEGVRTGVRASWIGERPYLDPASKGRRDALGLPWF